MERRLAQAPIPPLTPALLLIEKWAHHRGDGTLRGAGIFVPGRIEPVLRIVHGSAPIYARDLGKCLMVMGVYELPKEARERLQSADPNEGRAFLVELRQILMSCPRVGFALAPHDVVDPAELRGIVLDQTIQATENEAASFNRFCDAIQETETILLRVEEFLREFVPAERAVPAYSSNTKPPSELYL